MEYEPLFPYFEKRRSDGCFRVLCGEHVTNDSGTGIVHTAPGFGVEDYNCSLQNKIIRPDNPACPIDDEARFTSEIAEY